MNPDVSIIIPAYNECSTIGAIVEQLRRRYPAYEVIVVDDGSTDDTLAVARSFEDERLQIVTGPNRGACAARNTAIEHATGAYVQFLDADDLLAPDKIEVQVRRLERESERTVAICAWAPFLSGDVESARFVKQPDWKDFDPAYEWLIQSWNGAGTMPTFTWLLPRAVVDMAGPWDEALMINQDGEYIARVLVHASAIVFCDQTHALYRRGISDSISQRRGPEANRSLYRSYALCDEHLLAVDNSPRARQAVAGLWQSFLFRVYPDMPELSARAEARIAELGGGIRKPGVSRPFQPIRDYVGWKPALRLQRIYSRLRYKR